MSIFGKLLAILNVLAAGGAIYLMAMNYSRTRAWEYVVFRQDLLINGLPLDKETRDPQGNLLFEDIGPNTQRELFPSEPVLTQQEEVERVKRQVQAKLQGVADKKTQVALYARTLLPMALTNFQRERMLSFQTHLSTPKAQEELKKQFETAYNQARAYLQKAQADPKKRSLDEAFSDSLAALRIEPAGPLAEAFLKAAGPDGARPFDQAFDQSLDAVLAELQGQLDGLFQDALKRTENGKERPDSERRRIIAILLFNLSDSLVDQPAGSVPANQDYVLANPTYKRFLTVVGLKAGIQAIHDQAQTLGDVADYVAGGLDLERKRERTLFAMEHEKLVEQVRERAADVAATAALLDRRQKQLVAHEEELKKRRLDVATYEKDLDAARKDTQEQLTQLRQLSDLLYTERLKLRGASSRSQGLERDIRILEEGR
jgi:hypothetical protein